MSMFKSKRRLKNKNSSTLWQSILLLVIFLSLFTIVIFTYQMFLRFNKRPFISPIPITFSKTEAKTASDDIVINNLESLLKKNNVNFFSVDRGNLVLKVKLTSGEELLFSEDKDLDTQISSLQLILSRLTIEGKRFDRIDLRFDKPIIQFK